MLTADSFLSVDDLFTMGLGLDVSAAYLLGRGLLASPADIRRQARTTWGWQPSVVVSKCRDRVDARAGVVLLLSGFVLQATGYVLSLLNVSPGTGTTRAVVAAALAILATAISLLAFRRIRDQLVDAQLVNVASFDEAGQPRDPPDAGMLLTLGMETGRLGMTMEGGLESSVAYSLRVFGVEAAAYDRS